MAQAVQKQKPKEENVKKAIVAAVEVISESAAPGGQFTGNEKIGDGTIVWIPDGSLDVGPHNPNNPEDRREAIERCMAGRWARDWTDAVVGSGAPEDVRERTKRVLCEGLYD